MQRMTWTWTEEEEEEEVDNFEGAAGKAIVPSRGGGREGELVTTVSLFFIANKNWEEEEKWCNKGGSKNKIRLLHFICPIDGICTLEWNVPSTTSQPGL